MAPSEWTEVRRSTPAEHVSGVPDAATVWAAWIREGERQHSVTIYRHEGRFWVVEQVAEIVTRSERFDSSDAAEARAEELRGAGGGDDEVGEGLDEERFRAYCQAIGGELYETPSGTLTCEVAGGRVFGTAGEIVVELRPNDDVVVRATPEIGLGRDLRVVAPSRRWTIDQGVDDGNLLTTLHTVDGADVDVSLGVYGPEARRSGSDGIEVFGADPDEVLLDHG